MGFFFSDYAKNKKKSHMWWPLFVDLNLHIRKLFVQKSQAVETLNSFICTHCSSAYEMTTNSVITHVQDWIVPCCQG